ncbi:MAG: 50S ribosomal protein L6 [Chitinophagaceae bacterium]
MSRIGKNPIEIPSGVTVKVDTANVVSVKGTKGELQQAVNLKIKVKIDSNQVVVERADDEKQSKSLHGLYRMLIANMVQGVSKGFERKLELVGVGYRATAQDNLLDLSLGYSHNFVIVIPKEIKVSTTHEKGKNPTILLESFNKQLLGMVAAKIRSLRKPEPYQGKGVRYSGEFIRKKAGKTAAGSK